MKSNINFTCQLDNGWSLKYEWLGNGQVHIGVHWKGKVQATYSGTTGLDGLRTMIDTFDSLDMGEKNAAKQEPERRQEMNGPSTGRGSPGDPANSMGM